MAKSKPSPKDIDEFSMSERLKYLRQVRDLSQKELSNLAEVSQSTVAQIEGDKMDPSIKTLERIADALGVEPAIFFTKAQVHVFDLKKLKSKYKSIDDLNPTLYRALDQVVRYAKDIGFI